MTFWLTRSRWRARLEDDPGEDHASRPASPSRARERDAILDVQIVAVRIRDTRARHTRARSCRPSAAIRRKASRLFFGTGRTNPSTYLAIRTLLSIWQTHALCRFCHMSAIDPETATRLRLFYSCRSARIGSMRLARCAGINPAAADTSVSRTVVEPAINGSLRLDAVELRRDVAAEQHAPPECRRPGRSRAAGALRA